MTGITPPLAWAGATLGALLLLGGGTAASLLLRGGAAHHDPDGPARPGLPKHRAAGAGPPYRAVALVGVPLALLAVVLTILAAVDTAAPERQGPDSAGARSGAAAPDTAIPTATDAAATGTATPTPGPSPSVSPTPAPTTSPPGRTPSPSRTTTPPQPALPFQASHRFTACEWTETMGYFRMIYVDIVADATISEEVWLKFHDAGVEFPNWGTGNPQPRDDPRRVELNHSIRSGEVWWLEVTLTDGRSGRTQPQPAPAGCG